MIMHSWGAELSARERKAYVETRWEDMNSCERELYGDIMEGSNSTIDNSR